MQKIHKTTSQWLSVAEFYLQSAINEGPSFLYTDTSIIGC